MPKIAAIHARQVLDSRGNPTVEVEVCVEPGIVGRAAVEHVHQGHRQLAGAHASQVAKERHA